MGGAALDRAELERYLERIGLAEAPAADAAGLAAVQRAHLTSVPFENLDIVEGKVPLALDEAALFEKIVVQRRGGICYEQNLLFAAALRALGFPVELKGGRHPKYGDDMDHLFLLVRVPDDDVPRVADVGFAANFASPLRLVLGEVQDDGRDRYLLEAADEVGEGYVRLLRIPGLRGDAASGAPEASGAFEVPGAPAVSEAPAASDTPEEMFAFGPRTFAPADCRTRCDWFSTAPESRFTQGPLVTLDTGTGRRTLSARHYIETEGGVREVGEIGSRGQFERCLHEKFGL